MKALSVLFMEIRGKAKEYCVVDWCMTNRKRLTGVLAFKYESIILFAASPFGLYLT